MREEHSSRWPWHFRRAHRPRHRGIGSAQDTVNELEDNGFKVVLNKMGAGPLDHCTVDSVRPGETVTRPVHSGGELVNEIMYQTVYLTAKC